MFKKNQSQVRPGHVILPNPRSFTDHRDVCSKFHGSVSVIRDLETQEALMEEVAKHPSCTQTGSATERKK